MINFYDIAYGAGVTAASPIWLLSSKARTKVLRAFGERMGRVNRRDGDAPAVLIHAVSLGEMNATRELTRELQQRRPDLHVIVSTTTDTGFDRGRQLYGDQENVTLIRYPLDFTSAVNRVLDRLRPGVVVLMELELWPNFLRQCEKRNIPALLINGRLTTSSFKHYRWARPIVAGMFRRVATLAVQDEVYAKRFIELGAPPDRVKITGTMKFDTAKIGDTVEGASDLAAAMDFDSANEKLLLAASTGPGEEEIILREFRELTEKFPDLRLAIVPRHPQRFDDVAKLIERAGFTVVRRSKTLTPSPGTPGEGGGEGSSPSTIGSGEQNPLPAYGEREPGVLLGDTMGELKKFYALCTIAFVGRSLVDLGPRQHGSDMIEPTALGKPVIVGPFTHNFADAMQKFRSARALVEVPDGPSLLNAVINFLNDPASAAEMGARAQDVVRREQGATHRHADIILAQLKPS